VSPKGQREGDDAVLAALATGDADAAGVEVDVVDADRDQLGDPDPGVEQRLDQHDVATAASLPDRPVVAADLFLGGHVGQCLRLPGNLDVELGAQRPEDGLEVGIVRSLGA
jgi:hypothetical protein